MSGEVCRRRLPGFPQRGIPVPRPGRGVHRGTLGPFFRLFMKTPLSETAQKWFYVKVLQKQAKPDLQDRKGLGWHGTGWCPIPCNRCNRDTWRCFSGPRASEIFTILRWPGMQRLPKSHTQTWILLMGRRLCDLGEISPRLQVADATSANFTKPVELAEVA